MRRLFIALCLCFGAVIAHGQTCSPIGGIGNVQFLDNSGVPLTSGVLYSFVAGTSTQQATFTDSTCTVQNVNPITFGSGARVAIWLTTANFYKFVLCAQNDGASCAGGDILFSVDQVPGGVTGGGGGGGSPFISASANPATSGILRLSSGDTVCWRNTANSANLCFSKDTNDLLSWAGGSLKFPEVGAPTGVATFDILYADTTAHRWKQCNNGGSCSQLVASGIDVNTSDQVTQLHFGSTATPLSGTAPTTGQVLQWNGSTIVGSIPYEATFGWGAANTGLLTTSCITSLAPQNICAQTVFAQAHTLVRFTYIVATAPSGCGVNAVIGVRDVTAASNLATSTVTAVAGTFVDSGALSVSMPAGHTYLVGLLTAASGCGTSPGANNATMVYQ